MVVHMVDIDNSAHYSENSGYIEQQLNVQLE